MAIMNLTEKDISTLTEQDLIDLVVRLDQDDYNNPFESLEDWHILRTILFQRQDLAEPYLHLLDIEAYDEAWII